MNRNSLIGMVFFGVVVVAVFSGCQSKPTAPPPPSGLAGATAKPKSTLDHDNSAVTIFENNANTKSAEAATPKTILKGRILEILTHHNFAYVHVKTAEKESWVALIEPSINVGDEISVEAHSEMTNFKSKALGRMFDRMIFGKLINDE